MRAIDRLDIHRVEAEKESVPAPLRAEEKQTAVEDIVMLFRTEYRLRTLLALFVLGACQLSGIDGVLYVSAFDFSFAQETMS